MGQPPVVAQRADRDVEGDPVAVLVVDADRPPVQREKVGALLTVFGAGVGLAATGSPVGH